MTVILKPEFVHLHNHFDQGSLLDGHMRPAEGIAVAKALGMKALGISDHGAVHAHYQFYIDAIAAEIQPIHGVELYVSPSGPDGEPSDRTVHKPIKWRKRAVNADETTLEGGKDVAGNGKYTHQTVWAYNATGLRHLWQIISRATKDGIYGLQRNPRADHDLIRAYAEGLIGTTGCPSGEVSTRLRLGQIALARAAVARDLEIFGRDHYFLEVMDHGIDVEKEVRDGLLDLMRYFNLRPLVTNDAHYATADKAASHDALICVQTGKSLDDPHRFKFDGDTYSLRPAEEMHKLFADTPFAAGLANTLLVAEMTESYAEVFAPKNRMPVFPVPGGGDAYEFLWTLIRKGLAERYSSAEYDAALARCTYEMTMIRNEARGIDYVDYLLVLWDLCGFMRREHILFGPRGSAGGSAVLYALYCAAVDPIRWGLAFERFINPDRVSPPDVDVDVSDRDRVKVIAYLEDKYGADHVAANITFGYIGGKAALKDAARITDQPVSTGDALSKAFPPPLFGKSVWLADQFDAEHFRNQSDVDIWADFDAATQQSPAHQRVVAVARGIERRVRSTGEHACAAIISSEPLWGVVPLEFMKGTSHKHVCFEYKHVEKMGLQKFDLLGLRNWRIVARTQEWVKALHDVEIDLDDEMFDDPAVYQLLAKGHTLGVFQLEGGGMQKLLRAMRPTRFDDIMAVLALYRPGPMSTGAHEAYARRKTGQEAVAPIHEELTDALAPILGPTFGLLVFQEQVMAAVQAVAGFSLGEADLLRKAMGKKDKAYMDEKRVDYYAGAETRGFSHEAAEALWTTIEPFADYAFGKAHTASYGRLAYWTAWFKAHYPTEFMAATLDAEASNKDKLAVYLSECRRLGIKVTVPDINESDAEFTPTPDGRIRFGLAGIRSVGDGAAAAILTGRATAPYRDFVDFLERAGEAACTKVAVEGLAEAGAFDGIEPNRRVIWSAAAHAAKAAATAKKRQRKTGQVDLFTALLDNTSADQVSLVGLTIDRTLAPFARIDQLDRERARLGLYLSGHPLDGAEAILGASRTESTADLLVREPVDRDKVIVSGMIMDVTPKVTRKDGKKMAVFTVEDLDGAIELVAFPKDYEAFGEHLAVGRVVAVAVSLWVKAAAGGEDVVDDGSDPDAETRAPEVDVTYCAKDMRILDAPDPDRPVVVWIRLDRATKDTIDALQRACERNPGEQTFQFAAANADWTAHGWRSAPMRVDMGVRLQSEIKALVGRSAFIYTPATAAARRR